MSDELLFLAGDDDEEPETSSKVLYKVLVVDDEPDVHTVTRIALSDFTFDGHGLDLIHAYSAKEAQVLLEQHPDTAIILLDVVMESETAGLLLIDIIRTQMKLSNPRIVLRTGQPGQAPEQEVIVKYDINDYKSKMELTSQKLFTLMHTCLRSYRDIIALEQSKNGLQKVIQASKGIFDKHAFDTFISGTLQQLIELLHLDEALVMTQKFDVFKFADADSQHYETYDRLGIRKDVKVADLPCEVRDLIQRALSKQSNIFTDSHIVLFCRTHFFITIFIIRLSAKLSTIDQELINIFSENINIGLENVHLEENVRSNQKEIVYRLGEIVENRSRETGYHVKRVALYCELLAKLAGLPPEEVETIKLASPLHDIGKIAIPDAILNKPGKLDPDEWTVMKTHALKGAELLEDSSIYLLRSASTIAATHHEKWDGSGYPNGTLGEDIHIFGRITALADVFDALSNRRCYKPAWPIEKVLAQLRLDRALHFDPLLVDLLLDNLSKFTKIRDTYIDE